MYLGGSCHIFINLVCSYELLFLSSATAKATNHQIFPPYRWLSVECTAAKFPCGTFFFLFGSEIINFGMIFIGNI